MRRENIMARRDWTKLQAEYEAAFNKTGITIKSWCDEKGINYNSARRYLKVITKSDQSAKKEPKLRTLSNDTSNKQSAKHRESDQQSKGTNKAKQGENFEKSDGYGDSAHSGSKQSDQLTDHFSDHSANRNHLGHFQRGNNIGFQFGNEHAVRHNAYAKRLKDIDALFDAKGVKIDDDIEMCRARVMIAMDRYNEIQAELNKDDLSRADKIRLWDLYQAAEVGIDRNMSRVESLLRTKEQVNKMKLESERLAAEQAGLGTAIADIVAEIQAMDSDGFVVH